MTNIIKNKYLLVIAVFLILLGLYSLFSGGKSKSYESLVVKKTNVTQAVNVTGNISPANNIDLALELSGKIDDVFVKVGDFVEKGQKLVRLNNKDILTQIAKEEASLENAKAQLEEIKKGARKEEIKIAETNVKNTENALIDAKINLANVKQKADLDLKNSYDNVSDVLNDAYTKVDDALNKQIVNLFSEFTPNDFKLTFSVNNASLKNSIESEILISKNELMLFKSQVLSLNENSDLDTTLTISADRLKVIRNFLSSLSEITNYSIDLPPTTVSSYKSSVNTAWANTNTAISNINKQIQSIASQKITNQNNIFTASSSVREKEDLLENAKNNLALKKAGATKEQLRAQESKIIQIEATIKNLQVQLSKTTLYSPIEGLVTRQDFKIGEIASSNITLVSIIDEDNFEIKANITEADITKINIGDNAKVTLDAYGDDLQFSATVTSISPIETIITGVSTYKTILTINDEKKDKIKSGMTANIDILTGERKNVIAIPKRAVVLKDGKKEVRFIENGEIISKEIKTGLNGSNGLIEITNGINEGDEIVTFINKNELQDAGLNPAQFLLD